MIKRASIIFYCIFAFCSTNPTTFTVTNTNDSGSGSLRDAISLANLDMSPPTIIDFNIPGSGVHTITPTTFFFNDPMNIRSFVYEPFTHTITLDATTQPGYSVGNQQIEINCMYLSDTFTKNGNCLTILGADNCVIKGLIIDEYVHVGLSGRGISIQSTSSHGADQNMISECRIGSFQRFGNTRGIVLDGGASASFFVSNTIIGGPNASDANVLSGNSISGIAAQYNVINTVIQNNFIGCNFGGTMAVGNAFGVVFIGRANFPCNNNSIIDNVIAGDSAYGIVLQSNVNNSIIQNNKIGVDVTGTVALTNLPIGILVVGTPSPDLPCTNNLIGGTLAGQGNIISGCSSSNGFGPGAGIYLTDLANQNSIQGNFIGTDITGKIAIPNNYGIIIQGDPSLSCTGNSIGGPTNGARNVISGNNSVGIFLNNNVLSTTIENNYIGVDVTGVTCLANGAGIQLTGSISSTISGFAKLILDANDITPTDTTLSVGATLLPVAENIIEDNIISCNNAEGIGFYSDAFNNTVVRNFIGTDASGSIILGNGTSGILFAGSSNNPSSGNLIGGTNATDGNIIKFNGTYGILFQGDFSTPDILNSILGNSIFLNANNGIELTNNGNNLQQGPIITGASLCGNQQQLVISGTAPLSPVASNFRLEFFVNDINRNPITEGQRFIGAIDPIATGAPFSQLFVVAAPPIVPGTWVSATATNLNNSGMPGDTSEFTLNFQIQPLTPIVANLTASPTMIMAGESSLLVLTISGAGPFDLVWSDGLVQMGVVSPVMRNVMPTETTQYSVTITDANGCTSVQSVIVMVSSSGNALSMAIREKYCNVQ